MLRYAAGPILVLMQR